MFIKSLLPILNHAHVNIHIVRIGDTVSVSILPDAKDAENVYSPIVGSAHIDAIDSVIEDLVIAAAEKSKEGLGNIAMYVRTVAKQEEETKEEAIKKTEKKVEKKAEAVKKEAIAKTQPSLDL